MDRPRPFVMRTICLAVLVLSQVYGCGPGFKYRQLEHLMASGRCDQAVGFVDQNRDAYGDNAELLYLLDAAIVNFRCGDTAAAQQRFMDAEDLADRLWTESVSANVFSLLSNDYLMAYGGEDFEKVMINLFAAMAYMKSGQFDDALVECRRLDTRLTMYNDRYESKNIYKEDALARYLSGILHEADRSYEDAFIDYLKAVRIYKDYREDYGTPVPDPLKNDLLRLGRIVDRFDDARQAVAGEEDIEPPATENREMQGRIVFLQSAGKAPVKEEDKIFIPTGGYGPITIAFPRMVVSPPECPPGRFIVESGGSRRVADVFLAEDINRIATKNLDDRKARIIAKTVARVVAKQVAIHQIAGMDERGRGQTIKILLNLINAALEQADTRSWRTLPGEIRMAQVFVPAGTYSVEVTGCRQSPAALGDIQVNAGETHFVFHAVP